MSIEQQMASLSAKLDQAITLLGSAAQGAVAQLDTLDVEARRTAQTTAAAVIEPIENTVTSGADTPTGVDSVTIVEQEPIAAGGTQVAEPVIQLTEKAIAEGYTLESFYKVGWEDQVLVDQGHAIWVTPAPVEVTVDELNALLGAKAGSMNDDGAAIFKLLKDKYKVNGVTDLDPEFYPQLKKEVEAL